VNTALKVEPAIDLIGSITSA